jgi:hypothetical protein
MKILLFLLLCFVGITAAVSGLILISRPDGSLLDLPLHLLQGTPFKNYLVPGLFLAIAVGGVNLFGAAYLMLRLPNQYNVSMAGGTMIIIYVVIQYFFIQAFSWFQILYSFAGLLTILIAYQLKGKWAV